MTSKQKKILVGLLKAAAGIGIIAWILLSLEEQNLVEQLRSALTRWQWVAGGFSCFMVCLVAIALRWQVLLQAQGIRLRFRRVLGLTFVGHFFNALMLGGTGGDIAKAYYVSREAPDRRTEAIATILVDRIIGLVTLIMIADIMILSQTKHFMTTPVLRQVYWWTLGASAVIFLALIATFSQNLLERIPFIRAALEKMQRVGRVIHRVYDAFYLYRAKPGALVVASICSAVNHVVLVLMTIAFGRSLEVSLSVVRYYAIVPVANTLGAMPVTPGGIGIREGAYVLLLPEFAISDGNALVMSLLLTTSMTLWSLIGGVVFMFYTAATGHSVREELEELEHAGDQ